MKKMTLAMMFVVVGMLAIGCGMPPQGATEFATKKQAINFVKCSNGNTYSNNTNQCYSYNEDSGQWESDTGTETEDECCGRASSIKQSPSLNQ